MQKKKDERQMNKWTVKGLQYHVPDAKSRVLITQLHCMKVNNVFIQTEFNLYFIYVYVAQAFLTTHFLNLLTQKMLIRISQKGSFQVCASLKSSGSFIIHLLYQEICVYPSYTRKFCPASGNDDNGDGDSKGVIRDAKNRSVGR